MRRELKQQQNLAMAAATVLYAGAIIKHRNDTGSGSLKVNAKQGSSFLGQLIAITILMMVLSFTIDQAPEFGGPLAVLIIVAALVKYSRDFGLFFNQTQGNKK